MIYAPGTLTGSSPDADAAADAPPYAERAAAPGAAPAGDHAFAPGYGPRPAPGPGAGPGEQQPAPEPDRSHHPYGESINGGDYAYVIREDPAPSRPADPRVTGRDAGSGPRPTVSQPPTQEPSEDPSPESATAYSPDDPAYGPPSPEWYTGETQSGQQTAEQVGAARGAFEPPPNQGASAHEPPVGQDCAPGGATPLEQIKDFYLTAEAISPENLDRRFDELLERQRHLISEYFSEAALQESPR